MNARRDTRRGKLQHLGADQKIADTTLGYGSEFRTVNQLRPIIGGHPNFDKLALLLTGGMPYVFKTELDSATKSAKLQTLLKRGNHKSAAESVDQLPKLLAKNVTHGFTIPIPVSGP
jgi:hypothetical protein